jgi:hypothetical protein
MKTAAMAVTAMLGLTLGCQGQEASGRADVAPGVGKGTPAPRGDAGVSEKEFPVPFYPNSKEDDRAKPPTLSHELPGGRRALSSSRITTDSIRQVATFYEGKMKVDALTINADDAYVAGTMPNGDTVQIILKKDDRGTSVGIGADVSK